MNKKWFAFLVMLAFVIALLTTMLGTGKNFSTFFMYLGKVELYNPFTQVMDDAKDFMDDFKELRFSWSYNPFKLLLNAINYQVKIFINVQKMLTLPLRLIYYVIDDLYRFLRAVYGFIA